MTQGIQIWTSVTTQRCEMGWEMGGRLNWEGTYMYLWQNHVDIWQKPGQYFKAIILQLKINKFKLKKEACVNFYSCSSVNKIYFPLSPLPSFKIFLLSLVFYSFNMRYLGIFDLVWYLSCLEFSDLLESMVFCLSLILETSHLLLLQIFLLLFLIFQLHICYNF